ncbi:MAG: hypothetical protein ABW360_05725 [Phenylobacterium sp.]
MRNAVVLLPLAAALSGCMTMSRSATVAPMSAAQANDGRIAEIVLTRDPGLKVTPEFDGIFRQHVQAKLDGCFKGSRPLKLEASIDRLDKANPVMTAVIGGANVLRGAARLVDPATGQAVADYKVGATIVGGRIGVVKMAEAEEQLSDSFGDELCKQAFPKPGDGAK